jgi:hypothetical protein
MKSVFCHAVRLSLVCLLASGTSFSQTAGRLTVEDAADHTQRESAAQPRVVRFSGALVDAENNPRRGTMTVTFSLYQQPQGGTPLWVETQNVILDEAGRYTALLGSASGEGLPIKLFGSGEARWLGVRQAEEGAAEQARVQLVSVPYALAAFDAQSLGGRPVTDFQLTRAASTASGTTQGQATAPEISGTVSSTANTVNRVAKFTALDTLGDSLIFDNGTNVGVGTTTPLALLELFGAANRLRLSNTTSGQNITDGFQMGSTADNGLNIEFWNWENGFMRFGTNNAEVIRVTSDGKVGIGTPTPPNQLTVFGPANRLSLQNSATGGAATDGFQLGSSADNGINIEFWNWENGFMRFATNNAEIMRFTPSGNVGIGTGSPTSKFEVISGGSNQASLFIQNLAGAGTFNVASPPPSAVRGETTATTGFVASLIGNTSSADGMGVLGQNLASGAGTGRSAGVRGITAITTTLGTGVWGEALQTDGDNVGVFGYSASVLGAGVQGWAAATTGDNNGVYGRSDSNAGTGVYGEATATSAASASSFPVAIYGKLMSGTGAAGLFDTNSSGDILVGRAGSSPAKVFRVSSTGAVFGNGVFNTSGADFAESVAVKNDRADYLPGDVIAIDTTGHRRFTKTSTPYSTLVAGIYSTRPGILASPRPMAESSIANNEEIPLAVVGIVPCKVTNENGMIKAGDLLVSSSREGYAMKGTDRKRMNGAVIGKALQDMTGSTSVIEVLVSLQ